jgi:hypothetical protein
MTGDSEEDTELLRQMAATATDYINGFSWCPPVSAMHLAYGIGGVIALFLVRFERKIAQTDDKLWIVVGDLPDAYLVVETEDNPRDAIERYCLLMDEWINEVLGSGNFADVFPVDAEQTPENAELLRQRLDVIRTEILPLVSAETVTIPD